MPLTVKEKIAKKITMSSDKVFVRDEFARLGGYRQVSRALADLVDEGRLMKAGLGIWVKSKRMPSALIGQEDKMVTIPSTDVVGVAMEVMPKLGYRVEKSSREKDRQAGRTTQIPSAPKVKIVSGRTNRKIVVNGMQLQYEKNR